MSYKLFDYQERIVNDVLSELQHYTRPFVVDSFQACLAGETKVLTPDGYRAIKDLHEGNIVGSWNGNAVEWNEIECRSITRSSHSPKPMIELEYEDYDITGKKIKRHCKTTYDHRFFDGTKYYPLYQLIWGDMEESQRVQLKLLCEQYGTALNDKLERGVSCWDNPTSEGREWISQDGAGRKDDKSSSGGSSDFYPKSLQQTDSEPYQWGQNRQSCCESRMGDQRGADTTRIKNGIVDEGKIRGHDGGTPVVASDDRRAVDVALDGMGNQNGGGYAETENHSLQRIVNRKQHPIQSSDTWTTKECYSKPYKLSAIRICEAEDYYAITVKHCHSYIIEGGFPTHNSGKSWMIAELSKRVGKCLVLCMSKELVEQDAEKIRAVGADCSIYSASCGEKIISNITVATIGSIRKVPQYCQEFDLLIVDEVDAVPIDNKDSMYMKFFRQVRKPIVGLTGTPFRTTQKYSRLRNGDVIQSTFIKSLDDFKFWGKIVHGISYKELLELGRVAPIQYSIADTDRRMLRENSTGLDYTEDSLADYGVTNRQRVCECINGALNVWKCKRVLVAVPNIEEAEAIAVMCGGATVHSKMPKKERTQIINKFKSGEIKVIVQVLVLNVGFDLPALDCVIFARPSKSLRIWSQFVMRGGRKDPEDPEKVCRCIDMGGMLKLYGRIEDVKVKGGVVYGTYGSISDKALNRINISEMQRRFC